jgi:hypothetical protein
VTGLTRAESAAYSEQVLVLQGWPRGFCPLHAFEPQLRCTHWCWQARVDAAGAARDLESYFDSLYGLGWHWRGGERRHTAA